MKKALSVTIGGIVFTIEEDAFQLLDSYLKDVRAYFSQNEDHAEIIADIESGIADKFQQSLRVSKQAVTKEDVELAIEQIGTVNDFKASEGEEKKEKTFFESRMKGKTLFRDIDNKVFEGVCAGLGNYFGIDPTFVRIVFIVLIFTPLAALSIIGYLVLWAIVPPAKTRIDRMKMSGEKITLSSFSTEEKLDEPKKKESSIEKLILLPFRFLGVFFRVIAKIFPLCLNFLAGFCIFGVGVGIVMVSILTGIFVLFRNRFIFDGPLSTFPKGVTDYLFIGALYFAVIFAFIYLIILGISVIKRKYIINGWMTAGFIGILVIATIICGIFGAGVSLGISQEYSNQPVTEQAIKLDKQFSSLRVATGLERFDVVYSPTQQVVVSGFKNDIRKISATIDEKGELIIDESLAPQKRCIFCGHNGDVKIRIETPSLSSVTVNMPMHGNIEGVVMTQESTYILGNSAHVTVSGLNGTQIYTVLQTGARLTLKGMADTIVARMLDDSFLEAQTLSVNHADINVLNSGKAYIDATKTLKGNTADEGEIYYVNTPQVTATDSAQIKQMIRGEILPE